MSHIRSTAVGGRGGTGTLGSAATRPPRSKRAGRTLLAGALAAATATSGLFLAQGAGAAPPAFPNNIVVFPDRDFVTVEGFQNRIGQTATLEVLRGGQVVGSARSVVAAGDVAFEVNHPGGACWGAGTDLQVTPDIRAGDSVQLRFGNTVLGDTIVQDAAVNASAVRSGNTVTVGGYFNDGVNPSRVEQRIINPDLKDTSVGRRDVRAVPGGTGDDGYTSSLVIDEAANTFTATYNFTGPDAATAAGLVASGGGERFMTWQVEDAAGNRQGLTIAEFGELGGPGMGGCPAGPADSAAPAGSYSAIRSTQDPTKTAVTWTPAAAVPDAQAVTGYSVVAIEKAAAGAPADAPRNQSGVRLGAAATTTTLTLDPAKQYDIEVRSLAGPRMSEAFAPVAPGNTPGDPGDVTPPTLTTDPVLSATTPNARAITVTSDGDVYYTTDGTDVTLADMPSTTSNLLRAGETIPITAANTRVNIAAFDAAGNIARASGVVSPAPAAATTTPTGLALEGFGANRVALSWNAIPDGSEYRVRVRDNAGVLLPAFDTVVTGTTAEITGLPKNTGTQRYRFQVQAKTPAGPAYSPLSGAVLQAVPGDDVTIGLAQYRTGDEFRLGGSGTFNGATITFHRGNAAGTGPVAATIPGMPTATVVPLAAPEIGFEWEVRVTAPLPVNPGTIWIKSSEGGIASLAVEVR